MITKKHLFMLENQDITGIELLNNEIILHYNNLKFSFKSKEFYKLLEIMNLFKKMILTKEHFKKVCPELCNDNYYLDHPERSQTMTAYLLGYEESKK